MSSDDLLDRLAESYVNRLRSGERPTVDEYTARYPELADEIREVFAAMAQVEEVALDDRSLQPAFVEQRSFDHPKELGDYRIIREVGRGGMGIVYEAEQLSLGRRVALKVLPLQSLLHPKQLQRFRREAMAAGRLQHPNIVPVYGVGEHDGIIFFAMQFVHGRGLDEVLVELRRLQRLENLPKMSSGIAHDMLSGQFLEPPTAEARCDAPNAADEDDTSMQPNADGEPESEFSSSTCLGTISSSGGDPFYRSVAKIGIQAADALHFAHGQGLLHRDVKPSNLLLDFQGNVWVTDFGLAKDERADDLTNAGDLVGTLRYMAPERFQGVSDAHCDVYSLGLTLYELLTLRAPFDSDDRGLLISMITHDDPVRPRRVDRNIPKDLETIVLTTIAKEPAMRYRSAMDLRNDLQNYLDGKPIHARRSSLREQAWLWFQRNPIAGGLAAAIATLLTIGLLSAAWAAVYFQQLAGERQLALQQVTEAQENAVEEQRLAKQRLYDSLTAQARARRWSGTIGRRFASLQAIEHAARLSGELNKSPDDVLQLRNDAIASMALMDLETQVEWPPSINGSTSIQVAFDRNLEHYARLEATDEIVIRRVSDNEPIWRLPGLGDSAYPPVLRFSPDGQHLVALDTRPTGQKAYVWEIATGEVKLEVVTRASVLSHGVDFSPSSRLIALPDRESQLCVYHVATGIRSRKLATSRSHVHCLRFSPDGKTIGVAYGHEAHVVDWLFGTTSVVKKTTYKVRSRAWSPDGESLAVTNSNDVSILDLKSGELKEMKGTHDNTVIHVFFNHQGDLLASAALDGATQIWNAARFLS